MKYIFAVLLYFSSVQVASACTFTFIADDPKTVKIINTAKNELLSRKFCGFLLISTFESIGKRDSQHKFLKRQVMLMLPKISKKLHEVDIVYWFHGLNGFSKKTFSKRLMPQYEYVRKKLNKDIVLVVPEMPWSRYTMTPRGRQGKIFLRKGQLVNMVDETETIVQYMYKRQISFRRHFVGHSAGGSALASASVVGDLCKVNPHTVLFSDATYGRWLERTWRGCVGQNVRKNQLKLVILTDKWQKPWKSYVKWRKKYKKHSHKAVSYVLTGAWSHGKIGNHALVFLFHDNPPQKYTNYLNNF